MFRYVLIQASVTKSRSCRRAALFTFRSIPTIGDWSLVETRVDPNHQYEIDEAKKANHPLLLIEK